MPDQKPKTGYVVPRNGAQGAPGYAMPPQPQRAQAVKRQPQPLPTAPPTEAPGPTPIEVPAEAAADPTPQLNDEELLLCRHLLYFTADGGNAAPPEVVHLAKGTLAKIENALLARRANDSVQDTSGEGPNGYATKPQDLPSEAQTPVQEPASAATADTVLHSQ